jgi:hypothetical protein
MYYCNASVSRIRFLFLEKKTGKGRAHQRLIKHNEMRVNIDNSVSLCPKIRVSRISRELLDAVKNTHFSHVNHSKSNSHEFVCMRQTSFLTLRIQRVRLHQEISWQVSQRPHAIWCLPCARSEGLHEGEVDGRRRGALRVKVNVHKG